MGRCTEHPPLPPHPGVSRTCTNPRWIKPSSPPHHHHTPHTTAQRARTAYLEVQHGVHHARPDRRRRGALVRQQARQPLLLAPQRLEPLLHALLVCGRGRGARGEGAGRQRCTRGRRGWVPRAGPPRAAGLREGHVHGGWGEEGSPARPEAHSSCAALFPPLPSSTSSSSPPFPLTAKHPPRCSTANALSSGS